ncbi:pentatricopeptide repeat-containing protein At4g02750-like [Selaginella moellendorffii]|uniref:pentatricopeptide repeat-containing protein At4g02750-like n=1 Tax=Selaginella moellendorffii TaxID=88036 RepID=UPI000D1D0617|nr:pentatricopeptide repeat-containing protein At4g02750-like [Selaginella moellendorffii]|eukprot:XP_024519274.1 pentatricopeptide repeat-containing protein At4g02750-like [Selaginella moellendorffii]
MPAQDMISWNTLLAGFADNGWLFEAKVLFLSMLERDVVSWNAMLWAYACKGLVAMARRLFDEMPQPSVVSWNSMLVAYAQRGCLADVEELFRAVGMEGVVANDTSFHCLIIGCTHAGSMFVGRDLFCALRRDFGMKPSRLHYGCMVDVFAKAGHFEGARELTLACFSPLILSTASVCLELIRLNLLEARRKRRMLLDLLFSQIRSTQQNRMEDAVLHGSCNGTRSREYGIVFAWNMSDTEVESKLEAVAAVCVPARGKEGLESLPGLGSAIARR